MGKSSIKLFWQSRLLTIAVAVYSIALLAAFVLITVVTLRYDPLHPEPTAFVFPLKKVLGLSLYFFAFFLLLSYEYGSMAKRNHVEETIYTTKKGTRKFYLSQLLVLEGLAGAFTLVLLAFILILTSRFPMLDAPYFWHIVLNLFLNIFLVSSLAIVIGGLLATVFHRLWAYAIMIGVTLLVSPVTNIVSIAIFGLTDFNAYYIRDWFDILPPNLDFITNFHFGFSVLPYRFGLIFFWGFAIAAIYLLTEKRSFRSRWKTVATAGCVVLCLANAFLFVRPASKMIQSDNPSTLNFANDFYYEKRDQRHETGLPSQSLETFQIRSYEMEFTVGRQLSAAVTLVPDQTGLDAYGFTLYHGYRVKKVENEKGVSLPFEQAYDYVIVHPQGAETTRLKFYYQGHGMEFYANRQGVNLPAYAAYYPLANCYELYIRQNRRFAVREQPEAEFTVRVNHWQQVFCNLPEQESNSFTGVTDGLTLVSGFYRERTEAGGIRFVYPYLDASQVPNAYIKNMFEKTVEAEESLQAEGVGRDYSIKGKTVFIVPFLNSGMRDTYLQDQVILYGVTFNLEESYPKYLLESEADGQ